MVDPDRAQNLRALVDMGSNGIRFSITDLSPNTARIMPTVYQDRAAISVYDAQFQTGHKAPIPEDDINNVVASLLRFKGICKDFDVPDQNIRLLATEATREAINNIEFLKSIKSNTGWDVELLSKEEEGRIGAMGVASSFQDADGLVMDLGGGSTQLTWMSVHNGNVEHGRGGSVSLPFGAAALTKRMSDAEKEGPDALEALRQEVKTRLETAFNSLGAPTSALEKSTKMPLFLSGGGFRGWGYLLMREHHLHPYPIPIINGFCVNPASFQKVEPLTSLASNTDSVFRVSDRRSSQVPAVAFLISALSSALPSIGQVRFCQGGVREGALFTTLSPSQRAQHPLDVATSIHAPQSAKKLATLLRSALPSSCVPKTITNIVPALTNLLYAQSVLPKETRAAAALRSTTSGVLAGVHGVIHEERAALALALCERWGAEVSPTDDAFYERVQRLLGPEITWWARYLGRVGGLIGDVYPAGVVRNERLAFEAYISREIAGLALRTSFLGTEAGNGDTFGKALRSIEKVGKKKNWVGGKDGWGLKVDVVIVEE